MKRHCFLVCTSVCAMLVLAGIIVYRNFQPLTENGAPIPIGNITYFREVDTQFMLAFPILACSFLCHFNVLPVYRSANSPLPTVQLKAEMQRLRLHFVLLPLELFVCAVFALVPRVVCVTVLLCVGCAVK